MLTFAYGIHRWPNVVKLLWEGARFWEESIKLLRVAEEACLSKECKNGESKAFIAHKRFLFLLEKLNNQPLDQKIVLRLTPFCTSLYILPVKD